MMMPTARLLPATLIAHISSESYNCLYYAGLCVSNFGLVHRILEHAVELVASLSVETVALPVVRS